MWCVSCLVNRPIFWQRIQGGTMRTRSAILAFKQILSHRLIVDSWLWRSTLLLPLPTTNESFQDLQSCSILLQSLHAMQHAPGPFVTFFHLFPHKVVLRWYPSAEGTKASNYRTNPLSQSIHVTLMRNRSAVQSFSTEKVSPPQSTQLRFEAESFLLIQTASTHRIAGPLSKGSTCNGHGLWNHAIQHLETWFWKPRDLPQMCKSGWLHHCAGHSYILTKLQAATDYLLTLALTLRIDFGCPASRIIILLQHSPIWHVIFLIMCLDVLDKFWQDPGCTMSCTGRTKWTRFSRGEAIEFN